MLFFSTKTSAVQFFRTGLRLFQVLCKLKKSDIRYVNSYVRAEPFFHGSALICIIQRILGMSIKPALIR